MADVQRVIATCGLLSVTVGSVNSIAKDKQLPSARFLIGSGVAFLLLSALAEGEPEVAKALSIAVLTTVLIGQGDGVLSYINHRGEIDTAQRFTPTAAQLADKPPTQVNRAGLPNNPRALSTIPQTLTIPGIPGHLAN